MRSRRGDVAAETGGTWSRCTADLAPRHTGTDTLTATRPVSPAGAAAAAAEAHRRHVHDGIDAHGVTGTATDRSLKHETCSSSSSSSIRQLPRQEHRDRPTTHRRDQYCYTVSITGHPTPGFLGPFHGAIAVPSVTRCRCCWRRRGHRCTGGVRQYR